MGSAAGYTCADCGYDFEAVDDFSFGFSGDVVTPVVCPEHGLVNTGTGINVARGQWHPETERKKKFPCRECGAMAPRWNRATCPKCGGEHLATTTQIMWD